MYRSIALLFSPRHMPRLGKGMLHILPIAGICAFFVTAPVAAHLHDDTPEMAHRREDTAAVIPQTNSLFKTLLDSNKNYTRFLRSFAPQAVQAAGNADPGVAGLWSDVMDWPVVAVHAALLPNGKVLAYDSVGTNATETYALHNFTRGALWDPVTNVQTEVNVSTGFNIFCSGLALLPDGRLFIAGGNLDSQLNGLYTTHLFDYQNNAWTRGPDMAQGGRWYPSVTPLANGEMLITGGGPTVPEVRQTDGNLRSLTTASQSLPLYPWMHSAPNGKIAYFGPDQTLRTLSTEGTGSWDALGQRDNINRSYGSYALYDIGKVLVSGGGSATDSAVIVDLTSQQTYPAQAMNYGRRQHNLTILADGSVLATGGNSSGADLIDMNAGVYPAERWDPNTGQWTLLSRMQKTRQYHSIALLLPDGRVLSAGGGVCGGCNQVGYVYQDAEIFSPPYLFKKDGSGQLAVRPQISAVPAMIGYNSNVRISTADAKSIAKVAIVRIASVTHSVNFTQRYIPLGFSVSNDSLKVRTPDNPNIAPPGYYLLFLINDSGVPSVGQFIQVDSAAPHINEPPEVSSPGNQSTPVGTSVELSLHAADPDSDPIDYSVTGLPPGLQLDSTRGAITGSPTTAGTYNVKTIVTDSLGASNQTEWVWLVSEPAPKSDFSNGLVYEYYEGSRGAFPNLDNAIPLKNGIVSNINLLTRPRDQAFAVRFRSKLRIPNTGTYTFYIKSTSSSRLALDGNLLLKNNNRANVRERSVTMDLSAGDHDFTLSYVNADAPPVLRLFVEGPQLVKQTVPLSWWLQPTNTLICDYYEGVWNTLPDFNTLVPQRSGFASILALPPRSPGNVAIRFRGNLHLAKTGKYRFWVRSYPGVWLWIDGVPRLKKTNTNTTERRTPTLVLEAGEHDLMLGYYQANGTGTGTLDVQYSGPGISRRPLGIAMFAPVKR